MSNRKRVLFLITNFGFGGAQRVLGDHSSLLHDHADVLEVVFNDWDEKRVYETGNPYRSLDVSGGGTPFQRIANFCRRISRLRKLKKEFRPDITISHLEGADYISLLSGGRDKKILVIHGSKQGDQNIAGLVGTLRHKMLMPWLYRKADRIITVSKDIRLELMRHYSIPEEKIMSLPNFFDCNSIAVKASEPVDPALLPLFSKPSFKLITFARLASQKNLSVLFPLFKALQEKGHNVQLYILGDGELRNQLLDEAGAVGKVWQAWNNDAPSADAGIFFLGYQAAPHAFLKHANLFLMPSLWEGFPMALCEAMASGIAVMAADCPTGPKEILDWKEGEKYGIGTNGALLPVITNITDELAILAWASAVASLATMPKQVKDLQQNGMARVRYYDRSVVGPKWCNAYLDS